MSDCAAASSLHRPFDAHLPLELDPMKQQRGSRMMRRVLAPCGCRSWNRRPALRRSTPFSRTMRAAGRPSSPTVASVIAVGSGISARMASREPALELPQWIRIDVRLGQRGADGIRGADRRCSGGSWASSPLSATSRADTARHDTSIRRISRVAAVGRVGSAALCRPSLRSAKSACEDAACRRRNTRATT